MVFPSTKPVAAPAIPEYEFNRAITTGMSAPPIGITTRIPRARAIAPAIMKAVIEGSITNQTVDAIIPISRATLITFRIGSRIGRVGTMP